MKTRLETPFKGGNVRALIKTTSNCENVVLYFSEKVRKIAAFAMLFLVFSDQTIFLKMVLASPNGQKYPRCPLVLKCIVTLARKQRLVILYFFLNGNSCQMIDAYFFMTANEI